MTKTENLDDFISQLVCMWIGWVEADRIFHSAKDPSEKYRAALKCEELISKRYKIINNIDDAFERRIRKTD